MSSIPIHIKPEKLKTATEEPVMPSISKLSVRCQYVFPPHLNVKVLFRFEERFEKLCFRGRLV